MKRKGSFGRREFIKGTVGVAGAATKISAWPSATESEVQDSAGSATGVMTSAKSPPIEFPRIFTGQHLKAIAFPLGGVAAGSLSLGGRGQPRDW